MENYSEEELKALLKLLVRQRWESETPLKGIDLERWIDRVEQAINDKQFEQRNQFV